METVQRYARYYIRKLQNSDFPDVSVRITNINRAVREFEARIRTESETIQYIVEQYIVEQC